MKYFAAFKQLDGDVLVALRGGKRSSSYGKGWETREAFTVSDRAVWFLYRGERYGFDMAGFDMAQFRGKWRYQGQVVPVGSEGGSKDFKRMPIRYWVKYRRDGDLSKGVECMLSETVPAVENQWVIIEGGKPKGQKVFFDHPRGTGYVDKSRFYGLGEWHEGGIAALKPPYSIDEPDPHPEGKTLADLFAEDET